MFFKDQFSFEYRFFETKRILAKYPGRVPIVCEKSSYKNDLPNLDKSKYLVPSDFTLGQFMYIIRERMKLNPGEALFFIISNNIHSSSTIIGHIYELFKEPDGFLYIQYCKENTFGQ